jgi:hypothetical protein
VLDMKRIAQGARLDDSVGVGSGVQNRQQFSPVNFPPHRHYRNSGDGPMQAL